MSCPKNSTVPEVTQPQLIVEVGFFDTPIDNRGLDLFQVSKGVSTEDALQTAQTLSSGLGQLCNNLHTSLNMGDLAYCDGVKAMAFIAESVSALIWSVRRATADGEEGQ